MATVSYHLISELACHHYWSMTASYQEQSWTNNLAAPTDVILHQLSHEMTEHDKKNKNKTSGTAPISKERKENYLTKILINPTSHRKHI